MVLGKLRQSYLKHFIALLLNHWESQVQNTAGGSGVRYRGMGQGLQMMWREEGMRGLFRGNGTNCARIVPNSAVKFFAYEEASQ